MRMQSSEFSFVPSSNGPRISSSILYGMQSSSSVLQAPRFIREFPLDLRYRPVLTPPTTPSPPRKRSKLLNLDSKPSDVDENSLKVNKSFSQTNQFSSTVSIDDKRYFHNSIEHVFPSSSKTQVDAKFCENSNSNEFIDITSSDNELDEIVRPSQPELFRSDSNLTEDLSVQGAESEASDEIVDIESNEDSLVFSDVIGSDEVDAQAVLENGKMFFEDPSLHTKAMEGFAKLFDSSMYTVAEVPTKKHIQPGHHRSKSDKKRVKSRKQLVDEETTSPVSGTIIRKLHDGEELVVRKGDIDPVSFVIISLVECFKCPLVVNRRLMLWK